MDFVLLLTKFHVDLVSQEEPVARSLQFTKLHVSLASLSEVGVLTVLWALTFPNLHRHHVYITHYPLLRSCARVFENNLLDSADSIQPIPTSEPNLFVGFLPVGSQSVCCVSCISTSFSTAVFVSWPANLVCCLFVLEFVCASNDAVLGLGEYYLCQSLCNCFPN